MQKALCSAATRERHNQHTGALATGATRTPRTMQHRLGIVRKIGMNDEVEIGQIDAARGNVGCHADAGTTVAHCLQGVVAFGLAQFARQRNHGKAAIGEPACHMLHRFAGRAENDRVL